MRIIFIFNCITWFHTSIQVICTWFLINGRAFYTFILVLRRPWLFISRIIHWIVFLFIFLNQRLLFCFLLYFDGLILLFFTKFPINYLFAHLLVKIADGRFCTPFIGILFAIFLSQISFDTSPQLRIIFLIFIGISTIIISVTVSFIKLIPCIIISFVWNTHLLILDIFLLFLFFQCFLHIQFLMMTVTVIVIFIVVCARFWTICLSIN